MRRRTVLAGLALLAAAGCAGRSVWAPDEAVAQAAYRDPGPPALTLFTVINNDSGGGEHSALMISASQRVLFDPAGSWYHPAVPERNDLHFGITDPVLDFYIDYHARRSYRVVRQTVTVPPETAERALAAAQTAGPVAPGFCAVAVGRLLRQVPGFESMPVSFQPLTLMKAFGRLPGVTSETIYDDDEDFNRSMLAVPAR